MVRKCLNGNYQIMIIHSSAKSAMPSKKVYKEAILIGGIIVVLIILKELAYWFLGLKYLLSGWDIPIILILGILGFTLRISFPLIFKSSLAKSIQVVQDGITIYRFDNQEINISWNELTRVGYDPLDEKWELHLTKKKYSICSEGFIADEWIELNEYIFDHLPEFVDYENLGITFGIHLCHWISKATFPTIIIGIIATIWTIYLGYVAESILVGGAALTILLIYIALYYNFGYGFYETPTLNFLGWLGFYGLKLLALLPLSLIYFCILNPHPKFVKPPVKNEFLYPISNIMFFGGMALAIIFIWGLSYQQDKLDKYRGINKYRKHIRIFSLVVCSIGFLLKIWNES